LRKTLLLLTALFALGLAAFAAEPPLAAPAQPTLPSLSAASWLRVDATPQPPASGPFASVLLGTLAGPGSDPHSAASALGCPNHPPGWCCSGPPTCRCTIGPCL